MDCSTPGLLVHHQLPESIESVMPSNHLILSHPLLFLPSFQASGYFLMSQLFASSGPNTGASASTSVLPMNIQGSFPLGLTRFYLLAVQGALKSFLQHHSSKVSILWCSAFFMVQLSYPYITIGKAIALTICTFAGNGPHNQSYDFSSSHVWMCKLDHKEGWAPKNWCFLNCGAGEDSWDSLGLQRDQTSQS